MGKDVIILRCLKEYPSKYLRMVGDVVIFVEQRDFQHDKDIMQVVIPSSITVRNIFLFRQPTMIFNASWCERQGSLYYVSKKIILDSERSIPTMVDRKDLFCEGQLCNTSSVDMSHGSLERSSTIL
jgi:hypothetical protein